MNQRIQRKKTTNRVGGGGNKKSKIGWHKREILTTQQRRAVKRLMRELKQIKKEPILGVAALPANEKDLFLWHANIQGPEGTVWEKGIFHVEMKFPENYPDNPPTLKLCTKVEHPNVFDGYICLDMLEQNQSTRRGQVGREEKELYGGWSTSYTVQSILIQLQAFLFEAEVSKVLSSTVMDPKQYEKKKREWHSAVEFSVQQSLLYKDKSVNHFPPRNPWPPLPTEEEVKKSNEKQMTEEERIRAEMVCYYTRQTFEEDCLGLGIRFTKNLRTGELNTIHADLDMLSLRGYMNHKVRYSANNEPFTHWLPLYINEKHAEKGMYLSERAMSIILTGKHTEFEPMQAFDVFPKIMNSFIVTLMSGKKHHSIKAMRAYCYVHRLFLQYCIKYPEIQEKCNKTVEDFINNGEARHKSNLANLGEFLAMLSVTNKKWENMKSAVIDEFFTRSVFWILNKYPELEDPQHDEITDEDRLTYSYELCEVSAKNLLFHIFFLKSVANMEHMTLKERAAKYDTLYGRCAPSTEDIFISACEKFLKLDGYKAFFDNLGEQKDTKTIVNILNDAVLKSKEKGYHGTEAAVLSPEEFAKQNQAFDFNVMCKEENGNMVVIDDEAKWKTGASSRWGFTEIPDYLQQEEYPWRKLYLQHNLQDFIAKFNDNPDFHRFHKILDISQEIPRLEIMMFNPTNIKSKYFYLTCLLTKLNKLNTLIIRRGTESLGVRGFKALIKGLTNNPGNLKRLILEYCGINGDSIKELTKGTKIGSNLEALTLRGNPIGDEGARNLANFLRHHQNLPNLVELDLSDCRIRDEGASALAEALLVKYKIRKLNILNNAISNGLIKIFQNLSYNPSIESVDASRVTGNTFYDNGYSFAKLLGLTVSLKSVNLWKTCSNRLDKNVFEKLAENNTVEKLDFGDTQFHNRMADFGLSLAKNTSLVELNLEKNGISINNINELYNSITQAWKEKYHNDDVSLSIKQLQLSNNNLRGQQNEEKLHPVLGRFISVCKNLTYLNLNNCRINYHVSRYLSDALLPSVGIPLETLLLRGNNLGKLGIKHMRKGLSENTSIRKLDLSGNDLGVTAAQFIAEIIESNQTIEDLNLYGNFLEIEGVTHVVEALIKNKTLKRVDLGLNRAKVRGVSKLIDLFKENSTLEHIALKHNYIKDKMAMKLAESICDSPNSQISYIALAGNPLSKDTRREIALKFKKVSNRTVDFDLSQLVEVKDPERLERTVYLTPLRGDITELKIKKLFYDHQCGVILSVKIHKHKSIVNFSTSKYAFVEFAHPDSVLLARNLSHKGLNVLDGQRVRVVRAGI